MDNNTNNTDNNTNINTDNINNKFSNTITNIITNTTDLLTNSNNREMVFWYCAIMILITWALSIQEISIAFIFGIGIAILVVYILAHNNKESNIKVDNIQKEKAKLIRPYPRHTKPQIINYLFSIQDFYEYNPQAYEDMVESIDLFFDRYHETLKDPSLAGINYDLMLEQQQNAINSIQSIIYRMPINKQYSQKLKHSVKIIRNMLDKFLNEIIHINNKYNHEKGVHTTKSSTNKFL